MRCPPIILLLDEGVSVTGASGGIGAAAAIPVGPGYQVPLARAVIGGLTVSTVFTLFLVPTLYTVLGKYTAHQTEADEADDDEQPIDAEDEHA